MNVELADELFLSSGENDARLIQVITGELRKHRIQVTPTYRSTGTGNVNAWLARQNVYVRDVAEAALSYGLRAVPFASTAAIEITVRVRAATGPVVWPHGILSPVIALPLDVATPFLSMPLFLVLENGRNDWRFLLKIVPDTWRQRWQYAVEKRWIEEDGVGGINEVRRKIEVSLDSDDMRRLRTWTMFDNDGRHLGDESAAARATREACELFAIPFHELQRRAIENYIPQATLFDWASRRPSRPLQKDKAAVASGYADFSTDEQRHFFNLKGGFAADDPIDPIYVAIRPNLFGTLARGFHSDLAQHVWGGTDENGTYAISEAELRSSGFDLERVAIFQSIFGRL